MSTSVRLAPRGVDLRLALPALGGHIVAIVLVGVAPAAAAVAAGAAVLAGIAVALVGNRQSSGVAPWGSRMLAAGIPSLVAVSVVGAAVALAAPARTPEVLSAPLTGGGVVHGIVELERTVLPHEGGWSGAVDVLLVAVEATADDDRSAAAGGPPPFAPVRVPLLLTGLEAEERLPLGTRLEVRVRLVPLEPGDDRVAFARLLAGGEIVATPGSMLLATDDLRAGFVQLMEGFDGDGAGLLPGLAIGDTSAVDEGLERAMQRSSLTHLTAVSGANCAVVVGLVLGLGALLRWPRTVRVVAALAALGGFVVLVTPEPSVVRAAVMAAAVLVALSSGRPAQGLPVLGLAVLGIIVLDPWIAREYGFVLSVLATAALLVLAGPLAALLSRWMPAPLALALSVPLAAQLACQPVIVLLEPALPLTGVVANLLAAPAAPIATIVGMLACLAAPVVPPLAVLLAAIAWLPSAWIAGVARLCSGLPGAMLPWLEGAPGALLLAALTAAVLLAIGVPARLGSVGTRRRLGLAVAAVVVAVAGATAGASALRDLGRPDWTIAQCDVGQGDAVLLRSAGQVSLIDAGADAERLSACLDALGVSRIDLLVLTHFDLDHVGGAPAVVGSVDRVIIGPTDGEQDERLVESLAASGATVELVAEGRHGVLGDHAWRVLWPPAHRGVEPGNDASLVLEWRGAPGCASCPSMLALGDLGADAQRMLAAAHDVRPVDVVKVSHHGSPDQYEELYARVAAPVALIGVGADNSYGHPAPGLLAALDAAGSTVARSDAHGLTLLGLAPSAPGSSRPGLLLWSERGAIESGGVGAPE